MEVADWRIQIEKQEFFVTHFQENSFIGIFRRIVSYICEIPFEMKRYIMLVIQRYNCFFCGHIQTQCTVGKKCRKFGMKEQKKTATKIATIVIRTPIDK